MRNAAIDFIEKHGRCWYTIWGILGKRTYMGYSKKESERRYREEVKEKIFVNQPVKKAR